MKKHLTYLATTALLASPALAQDLTVTSFGGAYGAAQMEHMIEPYMKHSGTNVLFEDYGGGVAEIVGRQLRALGDAGQSLCVTHLPQVAAQAHQHLHIEKRSSDNETRTEMAQLDEAGRVRELARMLGGVKLSNQTLAHAREMLAASQNSAH